MTKGRFLLVVVLVLGLLSVAAPFRAVGQPAAPVRFSPATPLYDYHAALTLVGKAKKSSMQYHSFGTTTWSIDPNHPWSEAFGAAEPAPQPVKFSVVPPSLFASYNTLYPHGFNDRLLWQGRGFNAWSVGGIALESRFFLASLVPALALMENRDFVTIDSAEYRNLYQFIDNPQRFGTQPIFWYSGGDSQLRLKWWRLSLGIGAQKVITGPAMRNPIMLSTNAASFPHMDVGLDTWSTPFGDFEARALWGRTAESDHFDDIPSNNHNLFTLLSLAYRFPFLDSLTLGAYRSLQADWATMIPSDWLVMFIPSMNGSLTRYGEWGFDDLDQRAGITFDWRFPEVGFRFYGDWGRDDYNSDWRQLFYLPGHTQAYTFGFQKAIDGPAGGPFVLTAELSELWLTRDYYANDLARNKTHYGHGIVRQGHTHRGQVLGAGIGSGANAQYLGLRHYGTYGYSGAYLQRHARNQDVIYNTPQRFDHQRVDVEITGALEGGVFIGRHLIFGAFAYSRNLNRDYIRENDVNNFHFELGVQTTFR
mgnify:CR=1 FL=1